MKKASISILKAHLSRYVDAVKSGDEVIVTERGRPVARLSGLDPSREPAGRVALLIREGRLRPPWRPGATAEFLAHAGGSGRPAVDPTGRSLSALLEEREGGR
ncbi:MAG TPA: type II toxin-antitoxin system prevent-host-death family antitoxin [Longimicrobiales bacterium]|nr:type II toxin-antitoxin system prevent-host-death family antitoxin [Longimicrobiales bacterium]